MDESIYQDISDLEDNHWWFLGRKKVILNVINKFAALDKLNLEILDVGCGTGSFLNSLRNFGRLYGFESNANFVDHCRRILPEPDNIKIASLPEFPFKDKRFDLITALDVLEHIEDDANSIKTIYSHLKPGGLFLCTVPMFMSMWSYHDDLNRHRRRYSKAELVFKIKQAGFQVIKISYFNFFLFLPIFFVRLWRRLFPGGGSDFHLPYKKVNYFLRSILELEAFLIKYISLPFGVSLICLAKKPKN